MARTVHMSEHEAAAAGLGGRMSEKQLQQAVTDLARLLGWRVYHSWLSVRSEAGFPDCCMVNVGQSRLIFAELKGSRGKLKPEQYDWLADIEAVGVESYAWWPEHWHSGEIERVLQERPA